MKKIPMWVLAAAGLFFLTKKSNAAGGLGWHILKNVAGTANVTAKVSPADGVYFTLSAVQTLRKGTQIRFENDENTYTIAADMTGYQPQLTQPYLGPVQAAAQVMINVPSPVSLPV
jgi:hypothetical protein